MGGEMVIELHYDFHQGKQSRRPRRCSGHPSHQPIISNPTIPHFHMQKHNNISSNISHPYHSN